MIIFYLLLISSLFGWRHSLALSDTDSDDAATAQYIEKNRFELPPDFEVRVVDTLHSDGRRKLFVLRQVTDSDGQVDFKEVARLLDAKQIPSINSLDKKLEALAAVATSASGEEFGIGTVVHEKNSFKYYASVGNFLQVYRIQPTNSIPKTEAQDVAERQLIDKRYHLQIASASRKWYQLRKPKWPRSRISQPLQMVDLLALENIDKYHSRASTRRTRLLSMKGSFGDFWKASESHSSLPYKFKEPLDGKIDFLYEPTPGKSQLKTIIDIAMMVADLNSIVKPKTRYWYDIGRIIHKDRVYKALQAGSPVQNYKELRKRFPIYDYPYEMHGNKENTSFKYRIRKLIARFKFKPRAIVMIGNYENSLSLEYIDDHAQSFPNNTPILLLRKTEAVTGLYLVREIFRSMRYKGDCDKGDCLKLIRNHHQRPTPSERIPPKCGQRSANYCDAQNLFITTRTSIIKSLLAPIPSQMSLTIASTVATDISNNIGRTYMTRSMSRKPHDRPPLIDLPLKQYYKHNGDYELDLGSSKIVPFTITDNGAIHDHWHGDTQSHKILGKRRKRTHEQ